MTTLRIQSILFVLALASTVFSGCSTYRNATAYFNTYYNASHLFDEAVAELEKAPQPARDSNYFAAYTTPAGTIKKFESVIEKGSKVIQFHGESGFVEDAILMIGKSYLYQNETESATRKFNELLENFPESDKRPEARLWYAKSLYMGKNDEEALTAVKELTVLAQSELEGVDVGDDLLLEGLMLEAQIYADRLEYDNSAKTLARIETLDGDGRLKAIAQYQLGTVYETTESYLEAANAFNLVSDFSPDPAMSFNAKLRKGAMLSKAGRSEESLETFDEIIELPLKKEQSALVDFEIANTYWARGDSAAAFILYGIIDSTYKKTDASARAYYKRGDIHQNDYLQLAEAKDYYNKARTEYPASAITAEAGRRYTSLDHYFKTHATLAKEDSLWYAVLHKDSSNSLPDSGGGTLLTEKRDPAKIIKRNETMRQENVPAQPGQTQLISIESLSMIALRLTPRHLVADPEYPENLASVALPEESGDEERKPPPPPGKETPGEKKPAAATTAAAKPEVTLSVEKLEEKVAAGKYELGGILYLDLNLPDSALIYYGLIISDHPKSVLVPKALYAMSEVYRTLGDTGTVDSLYDRLLSNYPLTEYTDQVRRTRGLDTTEAVESPSLIRYRSAEKMLLEENPEGALQELLSIYAATTDSVIRPKACYAVGWIYENVRFELDSADAWYKKLMKDYPSSVYAKNAGPRVAVKGDTSKMKDYVKFTEIKAIPKPAKKSLGLIPIEGGGGQPGTLPGNVNQAGQNFDDDEGYDADKDIDPDDEIDLDEEDPDEEDPPEDDDPGIGGGGTGAFQQRLNQLLL